MSTEFLNRVQLRGRVGHDPKIITIGDTQMARFSLATTVDFRDKNGELCQETTWHNVTAYESPLVMPLENIKKGVDVELTGRLRAVRFTDSSGAGRIITEVYVQQLKKVESITASETIVRDSCLIEAVQDVTLTVWPIVYGEDNPLGLDSRMVLSLCREWAEEFEKAWAAPGCDPDADYMSEVEAFAEKKAAGWLASMGVGHP